MGINEFLVGVFIVASSGWGFSGGCGLEVGWEHPVFRVLASATTEAKTEGDHEYTYHGSAVAFLPRGRWAVGGGITHYGYEAETWSAAVTTPLIAVEYRTRHLVGGLSYTFQDELAPAVFGAQLRSELSKHLWMTARAQLTQQGDALAGEIGLQFRW